MDLPGIPKENIGLEVEGNTIKLSAESTAAERAKEEGTSTATYHRVERSCQYAQRALRFPEDSDMKSVSAHYENGVLTVRIAKKSEEKRDKATIKVT